MTEQHDQFTDPDSLVVTLRGGRVALYGDRTWIAVDNITRELAKDMLEDLLVLERELPDRVDADATDRGERPAYYCKRCGWSEDPANSWQAQSSDQAFHAPCPAPADDPGMAGAPPF